MAAQWPLALHLVNHGDGCGGYGMAAFVAGGVLQYFGAWCGCGLELVDGQDRC